MAYRLRPNLYYCIASDRAIFLDVDRGRYFCLPTGADAVFRSIVLRSGPLCTQPPADLVAELSSFDLFHRETGCERSEAAVLPPKTDISLEHPVAPKLRLIVNAALERIEASRKIRRFKLARLIAELSQPDDVEAQARNPNAIQTAASLNAAFAATDLVFGRNDRCLPRSLAFASACKKRGLFPMIVFGVRSNPFNAHCWVQLGSVVLNDYFERVRPFTPILAI